MRARARGAAPKTLSTACSCQRSHCVDAEEASGDDRGNAQAAQQASTEAAQNPAMDQEGAEA